MNQSRIKSIIEKLSSKELHNEESIKFCLLGIFSSLPNFINSSPTCIDDIKYLLKGCNVYKYDIEENETVKDSIVKFKSNWEEIINANIIIINNFTRLPDIMIPLKALLQEENKNLFSIIAIDEEGFNVTKDYDIFKNFSLKTKIDFFTYNDQITKLVNDSKNKKLYLPIEESFSKEELRYLINNAKKVVVTEEVMIALKMIFSKLEEYNENKSEFDEDIILEKDRWKEYISILKASAFLNGRMSINLSDLFLLKKMIWSQKNQIAYINKVLLEVINSMVYSECKNLKKYSMEMVNLLIEMTRSFKLMKKNNDNSIRNTDLIEWNSAFDKIKKNIVEIKYYARDFFDSENFFNNIFVDEEDKENFLNIFKIDDKLIFEWYTKLKTIINYINNEKSLSL
ncbi:MAG: hypothetical protein ACRDCD_02915 [Mycoplasmoidaceae bacterium]